MSQVLKSEWYDEKTPMARARRVQLYRLCDERGIAYPPDATKDQLLQIIGGYNLNALPVKAAPPREDKSILNAMSLFELRAVAKSRGIAVEKEEDRETILAKIG